MKFKNLQVLGVFTCLLRLFLSRYIGLFALHPLYGWRYDGAGRIAAQETYLELFQMLLEACAKFMLPLFLFLLMSIAILPIF